MREIRVVLFIMISIFASLFLGYFICDKIVSYNKLDNNYAYIKEIEFSDYSSIINYPDKEITYSNDILVRIKDGSYQYFLSYDKDYNLTSFDIEPSEFVYVTTLIVCFVLIGFVMPIFIICNFDTEIKAGLKANFKKKE